MRQLLVIRQVAAEIPEREPDERRTPAIASKTAQTNRNLNDLDH